MHHATCLRWSSRRKKKLKTYRDFPILIRPISIAQVVASNTDLKKTQPTTASTPPQSSPKATIEKNVVATAIPRTTAPNETATRRRKSIIRIKPKVQEEETKAEIHYGDTLVTPELLEEKWTVYSNKLKQTSGGFTSSVLANCEPKLKDDGKTVNVVFKNQTNEAEFTTLAQDLLPFLKSELSNNYLNFTTEINASKAKKTLYTNKDKFEHLVATYPQLNDWATKLGLELK